MKRLIGLCALPISTVSGNSCQVTLYGQCGNSSQTRELNCCTTGYCQPWNAQYYQCIHKPPECSLQYTDMDFVGNDIMTVRGIQPGECCAQCAKTQACLAYTFINENPDGQTACYLKSGVSPGMEKRGAISGLVDSPTCSIVTGSSCGNAQRYTCCKDSASYCQPWDAGYYQCLQRPSQCHSQEVNIDFYGNDLTTLYEIYPWECCQKCSEMRQCAAYTFVNENSNGKSACYLKSSDAGRRAQIGAVSATVNPRNSTCENAQYDPCGNEESGAACCPSSESYCQPWNKEYYQCIPRPNAQKCPKVETGVELLGENMDTRYSLSPSGCCDVCFEHKNCTAYTYVNENPDGRSVCHLKASDKEKKSRSGAMSGTAHKQQSK
uniref:Cellulose binding elicitor lectin (CBEL) putative n=1 Tax=Albugo laibachii Nc14 TaxID=890382 RepID=F0WDJ8_9STRA|nr:cellulose binding elicitor lectin (CBEL) putative [Albugo laibachii Nc14]|eukprot:CCA19272.1 cellulose binding elicitor lectin (CBEL) putative [Albugo laibachii Nc14]